MVWSGDATGAMVLDTVDAQDQGNSWVRVSMSFRLAQGPPRAVEIGIAPDMAGPVGTAALLVRKVMLHEGNLALPYSPTYPPDRSGLRASSSVDTRVRVYGEVWRLVTQRPLFGWGPRGFSHVSDSTSDTVVAGVAHEHSLPLWAALRYGLVGVAAVVLLFVGYYRLRPYQLAALAAVAAANLFDLTFWSAGVVLTLSLVIGADVPEPVSDREGVR